MSFDIAPEVQPSRKQNPALLRVVNALDNLGEPDPDYAYRGLENGVKVDGQLWDVQIQPALPCDDLLVVNLRNTSANRPVEYRTAEYDDSVLVKTRDSEDIWDYLTTHEEVQPVLDVLYAAARQRRQWLNVVASVQVKR
jgi:hypothetical protein